MNANNLNPLLFLLLTSPPITAWHIQPNFGGFGTDHCSGNTEESWRDRAEFVRVAASKWQALNPNGEHTRGPDGMEAESPYHPARYRHAVWIYALIPVWLMIIRWSVSKCVLCLHCGA